MTNQKCIFEPSTESIASPTVNWLGTGKDRKGRCRVQIIDWALHASRHESEECVKLNIRITESKMKRQPRNQVG